MNWARGALRVLSFDIENRPLSYLGKDFTTCEVTAIAAGWNGKRDIACWVLGETTTEDMLAGFVELYDQADIVSGHYIRRHDLPIINAGLIEHGMPSLSSKMTSDTYSDLVKRSGISASQQSLSEMLGVPEPKQGMSQGAWREANRLRPDGLAKTRLRVVQDVRQHRELRKKLAERDLLGPPRSWRPL